MFCADPDRRLITVLMTNRVYPSDAPGYLPVQTARREFNDAVLSLLEYRPEAQRAPLFKQCNATYGANLMMNATICSVRRSLFCISCLSFSLYFSFYLSLSLSISRSLVCLCLPNIMLLVSS
jgi:hypothetical protein